MALKLTRAQAIRKHCVMCSGGSVYEANKCTVKMCYLWPYRRGSGWEDPDTGQITKKKASAKKKTGVDK